MPDAESPSARKIRCPYCGAPLEVPRGASEIKCPFCGNLLELKKEPWQGEYVAKPALDRAAAEERFWRWTAERDKPATMPEKTTVLNVKTAWVPTWHLKLWEESEGVREIKYSVLPAYKDENYAALSLENLPLGALTPLTWELDNKVEPVGDPQGILAKYPNAEELTLVYVPVHEIAYQYAGRNWKVLIEGITGGVHAAEYPKKKGWPYYALSFVLGGLFAIAGFIDMSNRMCLFIPASIILGIPLTFILATIVARRV